MLTLIKWTNSYSYSIYYTAIYYNSGRRRRWRDRAEPSSKLNFSRSKLKVYTYNNNNNNKIIAIQRIYRLGRFFSSLLRKLFVRDYVAEGSAEKKIDVSFDCKNTTTLIRQQRTVWMWRGVVPQLRAVDNGQERAAGSESTRLSAYVYTHAQAHTHTIHDTNRVAIVCDFIAPKVVCARTHTHAIYLYYIIFKHIRTTKRPNIGRPEMRGSHSVSGPFGCNWSFISFLFSSRNFGSHTCMWVYRVKRPTMTGTRSSILCNICILHIVYTHYTGKFTKHALQPQFSIL